MYYICYIKYIAFSVLADSVKKWKGSLGLTDLQTYIVVVLCFVFHHQHHQYAICDLSDFTSIMYHVLEAILLMPRWSSRSNNNNNNNASVWTISNRSADN